MDNGKSIAGVILQETPAELKVVTNLLNPNAFVRINRKDIEEQVASRVSAMPAGLANVLTESEIRYMLSFLETGGYKLPAHLKHDHEHKAEQAP